MAADHTWTFTKFYQLAIKGQCSLKQLDAVSILLTGTTYDQYSDIPISPSAASKYVNGKKALSKEICSRLLRCTDEDVQERIRQVGIQNYSIGAERVIAALQSGKLRIAKEDAEQFDQLFQQREFVTLLAKALVLAIKSPPLAESGVQREKLTESAQNEATETVRTADGAEETRRQRAPSSNSLRRKPEATVLVGREIEDYYINSRSGNLRIFESMEDGVFFDHFIRYRMFETRELSNRTTKRLLAFMGVPFTDGRFPSIDYYEAVQFIQSTKNRKNLVALEACGSIEWIRDRLWHAPIRKDPCGFLLTVFTNPETEIKEIDAFYDDMVNNLIPSHEEAEKMLEDLCKTIRRKSYSIQTIYEYALRLHELEPTIVRLLFWTDEYQYQMYPPVKTTRNII